MDFDRDEFYTLSDMSRLFGIGFNRLEQIFCELHIEPDYKYSRNRYWRQDRIDEIEQLISGAGHDVKVNMAPKIVITEKFFDFDPMPDYFKDLEED